MAVAWGLWMLERVYCGLKEDGLLGAIHRARNPFGNIRLGDDVEHFNRYSAAIFLALLVGAVLAGVLPVL